MNNPIHPGFLVREEMETLCLSMSTAGQLVGIDPEKMEALCSGESDIDEDTAELLASFLDDDVRSAEDWLELQRQYNDHNN